MTLRRCTFEDVARHGTEAHADGLVLSRAMAHQWFMTDGSKGFVGTKQDAHRMVIGAIFMSRPYRENGDGGRMLQDVIAAAGNRDIEVTCPASRRRWFGKFGFIAARQVREHHDTWLMVKPKNPE